MRALPVRSEVWWCEVQDVGRRPVVVLSRDTVIPAHRRVLVAICTTTIRGLPSEVILDPTDDAIPRLAAVNLDSLESVPLGALVERIGRLDAERMDEICDALAVAVDCRR